MTTTVQTLSSTQEPLEDRLESSFASTLGTFLLWSLAQKNGLGPQAQLYHSHWNQALQRFKQEVGIAAQQPDGPSIVARSMALVASRVPKSRATAEYLTNTSSTGSVQHCLADADVTEFWAAVSAALATFEGPCEAGPPDLGKAAREI